MKIKLQQDQVWKYGDEYLLIVRLERLKVFYKSMADLANRHGMRHEATKKEFCRLLKKATLVLPTETSADL